MSDSLFSRHKVIDTDTHVTEPPGVWVDRVSKKWGDLVPHIEHREDGRDWWCIGKRRVGSPGWYSPAGFDGFYPDSPLGYADIPKASFDAKARLAHLDEEEIYACVLYPNVGGFGSGTFLSLKEPELMLECVRAYNDWVTEWCSEDPKRLLPVMALPFWDTQESVKEIQRCADLGFKSVLHCSAPQHFDMPLLADKHWDPIWAAANETGMSVSFHIGAGDLSELGNDQAKLGTCTNFTRVSAQVFNDNINCIGDLIFGGACHRFPDLKFISVESGVGWVPFYMQAFDWQWKNNGGPKEHPEYDLLPSEYFKRQISASFWFEEDMLEELIALYPDNIMWETDYPHPTSMSPGPASAADQPKVYAERVLAGIPEEHLSKVLHDNAAALYGVE